MSESTPVADVVLPELDISEDDMEAGLLASDNTPGTTCKTQGDCNFAARLGCRERQLREAITQRDAARKQLRSEQLNPERGRCVYCGFTIWFNHEFLEIDSKMFHPICEVRHKLTASEATLATEREISEDLRMNLTSTIADAKLWRDKCAAESARADDLQKLYDATVDAGLD